MIKRPITINAGEIKNSSQLLLLSFSNVNQHPSPPLPYTHTHTHTSLTDWNCCVYLRKRFDVSKGGVNTWGGEDRRRRRRFSRAEIDEMWQAATLLISMTQLSQPYFRKIKQPYGKLGCLGGGAGGARRVCVKMNKLVVCRWALCFSPPPTILSLWHGNGSKLMKTLHSFGDNSSGKWHKRLLQASSSITHEDPPSCLLGIGWAGNCLIS